MPQLLSDSEIKVRLKTASGWRLVGGRTRRIQKRYMLSDFVKAIRFVNRIGRISEEVAHHPDIDIRYDRVTLALSTHSVGGISDLDFEVADRFDAAVPTTLPRRRV
jgi:4a-hydroxytetrahydrobiopterin dehydratase